MNLSSNKALTISIFLIICMLVIFGFKKSSENLKKDFPVQKSETLVLYDFDSDDHNKDLNLFEAKAEIQNIEEENNALRIRFEKDELKSGVEFTPAENWVLDSMKAYCLVYDAKSENNQSTFLIVDIANHKGQKTRRIVNVHPGKFKSYFFEITTHNHDIESGMRGNPVAWETEAVPMKINGLLSDTDFSKIQSITFFRKQGLKNKSVLIDNIRIIESPSRNKDYLKGIADKFGQNAKLEYPIKIHSEKELREKAQEELNSLAEYTLMDDRSKFGGWKKGPKLKATGFFRKEKVNGKWALVDPEGYLFFSLGLANVRLANTTTYTGIDYKDEKIKYRDPEDVTPEDSKGIVEVPIEIMRTGEVVHDIRHSMFVELPEYDDPLAKHYSYRKESHFGPIEHGQTYSFYRANLERRYGEEYKNSFEDKWLEVTENRMRNWGFTSFGNWIDPAFYHRNKVPYFGNGWIIGDYQKVYSGSDYWGPMPDPFDPEFERRAKKSIEVVAEEVKNNPWCIGVFIDNERSWGSEGSVKKHYGLVLDGLSKDESSFLKKKFMEILKGKYSSLAELNDAWESNFASWKQLEKGVNYKEKSDFSEAMINDFSIMLESFATKYFQVIHDALEEKMPNHMYMGCRFAVWGVTPEVRKSAAKYVDVFSYNYYTEGIGKKYWEFLEEIDMPTIIGEYHIGAPDSGLFHSGVVHAMNQDDRAQMWKDYVGSVIDNPYLVGAHWFQYLDSPITGRAHDGENYNTGFVSITDIPYPKMVNAAKKVNSELYSRRFGSNNDTE